MKHMLLLALALLAGCSTLNHAGNASYSVKPFKDDAGALVCCAVDINNGKEIASLEAHVSKQGDDYTVDLKEQGVAAFEGQRIASDAFKNAVAEATKAAVAGIIASIPGLGPAAAGLAQGMAATGSLGAAAVGAAAVVGGQKAGVLP